MDAIIQTWNKLCPFAGPRDLISPRMCGERRSEARRGTGVRRLPARPKTAARCFPPSATFDFRLREDMEKSFYKTALHSYTVNAALSALFTVITSIRR